MAEDKKDTVMPEDKKSEGIQKPQASDKVVVNVQGQESNVMAMVEKARQEEKQKLYSKLEQMKSDKKKAEEEREQLIAMASDLETKLKKIESESASKDSSVEAELQKLTAKLEASEKNTEKILDEAAKLIRENDDKNALEREKEKRVFESGVDRDFVDLSGVSTVEEIDKAIQVAKVKQQTIEERIREKVRQELGASVPGPLAPQQDNTNPAERAIHSADERRAVVKDREQYSKIRGELLKRADDALRRAR